MEEVYYLKEIERIKSILQDYYNKDFNSDEEDFYVNKSNKEQKLPNQGSTCTLSKEYWVRRG